jgi:hypothetical protein
MGAIDQHGITISGGPRDIFCANHAACAGTVFHHHGLAQNIARRFSDDAPDNVIGTARGKRHNQPYRACRAPSALGTRHIRGKPSRQSQAQSCTPLHHLVFLPVQAGTLSAPGLLHVYVFTLAF